MVCNYIFWREDERQKETTWSCGWDWQVYGWRRRALRGAELEGFLRQAGFDRVTFLPKSQAWDPHELVATKA